VNGKAKDVKYVLKILVIWAAENPAEGRKENLFVSFLIEIGLGAVG
jgi:hypothetical protein